MTSQRNALFHCRYVFLILLAAVLALVSIDLLAKSTATVNGLVYTVGADGTKLGWPNARVTLKYKQLQNVVATVTNDLGVFTFSGLQPGDYEVSVTLAGFDRESQNVTVHEKDDLHLAFVLRVKKRTEQVEVSAESNGVETTSTNSSSGLNQDILESLPLLNENFQSALPLLPGVIRGPDGLLNIKGGRADQSSTLVNSASAVDPVSGIAAISLPLEAVSSARVLSNPFSTEYGRFAGGVVELDTQGGTDLWRVQFKSPFPRMRFVDGSFVGIASYIPRLTISGPIKRGKLYFLQSTEYNFIRTPIPSLPELRDYQLTKTLDSRTQLDWNITPNHHLTTGLSLYPQDLRNLGLGVFNPLEATQDYRQRGFFLSLNERAIFSQGGFLASTFSVKRFDTGVRPSRVLANELDLTPEGNFGTYFGQQQRNSYVYQWSQAYHFRPLQKRGTHLFTLGYSYSRMNYDGTVFNRPVLVLREPSTPAADCAADLLHTICTLSRRITYGPEAALGASKNDIAFYFQDNWQVVPRFSLTYGVRLDHDGLSKDSVNAAPRVGFVFAPTHDNKTAIRGGIGLFYDKVTLELGTFRSYPAQTLTLYASDGITIISGPTTYVHTVGTPDGKLRVPYSVGWNLQLDRELARGVLLRLGYEERQTHRDFFVQPIEGQSPQLMLLNSGRQHYREFQAVVRWQVGERTTTFFSYARSRAVGELNNFDQYLGSFPNPIVLPNEYGLMGYDTPNRFLAWGSFGMPWKVDIGPVFEWRDGFPLSVVDGNLNWVGPRNGAGRFPRLVALDLIIGRKFPIKVLGHKVTLNPALKIFNVTGYDNPREVQSNITSPNFGRFFNAVPRQFRGRFEIEF